MSSKPILKVFLFISVLLAFPNFIFAETVTGYAWGENIGWLDASDVVVSDTELTGYLYSGNIGWISMNCSNTSSCGTANYAVTNSDGNLSGYAWGENVGWIDMSDVSIDSSTGVFSGHAYSGNTGWISFNCSNTNSCGTVDYKVTTGWTVSAEEEITNSYGYMPAYVESVPVIQPVQNPNIVLSQNLITIVNALVKAGLISSDKLDLINNLAQSNGSSGSNLFNKDLELNDIDEQVRSLQKFLNNNGYVVAEIGPGSPGNETNIFGPLTRDALINFQSSNGISPAAGYFGPITRQFILNNY